MDPTWKMHMQMLTRRKKNLEIKEKLENAISEWYFTQGISEPNWKIQKDPQWWIDYINEIKNNKNI
jgi:hypothetical protein